MHYCYSLAADGEKNACSPFFKVREFACKDGSDPIFISSSLMVVLHEVRVEAGAPVYINSAYRTPAHNAAIHGASGSQHMFGRAADIRTTKLTAEELYRVCEQVLDALGIEGGLIWYPNFVHVDVREVKYRAPKK